MSWNQIYKDMAYSWYKCDLAEYHTLRDAITTLHLYVQGQAKAYEVLKALTYLEERFGIGVSQRCTFFRKALDIEEEEQRLPYCMEAIQKIERYLIRNHGGLVINADLTG